MKTRYGKGKRRRKAVRRAERKARRKPLQEEVRRTLQLRFDPEEVLSLLQGSLDTLAIELGRQVVNQFLERDVDELCGPRYQRQPERSATRYGHQSGFACIGGQKVSLNRPRVRSTRPDEGEVTLPLYEKLQQPDALPQAFLRRMVRGVSCRDYEGVMDLAAESFGVKKS